MKHNQKIEYSHRPQAGVSVGAYSDGKYIYIAAAFTNDGTSRNGLFHKERCDNFSRAIAREIIKGRIFSYIDHNGGYPFSFEIETDMSAYTFMRKFRQLFKPDPYERDNTFGPSAWRSDMWEEIQSMCYEILNEKSCV